MSFSREPPGTSAEALAATSSPSETNVKSLRMSEDLVQHFDQPARLQVVLDETLAEVADLHLSDRGRRHHVAGTDIGRAHDAAQHDELAIAVDIHLADTFEHQVAV